MKANVGIKISKPKLNLLNAYVFNKKLWIEYESDGDPESSEEVELSRIELEDLVEQSELDFEYPETFDSNCGSITFSVMKSTLLDYVSDNAEEIANRWLEKRASALLILTIESSINQVLTNKSISHA
ncbi:MULTISPECIES: hypothetical protein [unclassified Sphingobacterium]|uniref:hypothetical protein n=1 Tax=unclassified Sphingobacterium TaxID=2609468 RepID=UPI0025D93B2D|nr:MULTISPECIES: hypothetical protein [unclassified Sphingobacterium]